MSFQLVNHKAASRKRNFGLFGVLAGSLGWIADNTSVPSLVSVAGTIDGVNRTFTLPAMPATGVIVFNNGVCQVSNLAYLWDGNVTITFQPGYIPQPGDQLEAISY